MTQQRLLAALLVLCAVAALAATPIGAGFVLRPFACDIGPSPDWIETVFNLRHLVSFGILSALGFLVFRQSPVWLTIVLLVALTAAVEIEEAIFVSGHCRLRDLIPDVLAICIGWAISIAIARWRAGRSTGP